MITPRHIRLFPTPGLKAFQRTILTLIADADPWTVRRMAVLVPSGAAAMQLRYTIEDDMVEGARGPGVCVVPLLLTREGWYQELYDRSGEVIPLLAPAERHVLMLAAARQAAQHGAPPPFKLRAGLIPAVISFYDDLMRHRRSVDAFERLITADLEPSLELDRGARRLHRQTTFLASTFRRYESLLAERRRLDEHGVRRSVIAGAPVDSLTRVVVTLPDHVGDPTGLWPADYNLLTRLPGLERIDVVTTDRVLRAGFHDRLVELLPGIVRQPGSPEQESPPVVVTPADEERSHFVWRDREEELIAVIRGVKSRPDHEAEAPNPGLPRADSPPAGRVGVVFQRRLPYLYLARQLFSQANVAFEALDALPLAAEPYAAALDLVCSFVTAGYHRTSTIALLQSPHFRFELGGRTLDRASIEDLDRLFQSARFSAGRRALERLAAGSTEPDRKPGLTDRTNARAAAGLADRLFALEVSRPAEVVQRLTEFRVDGEFLIGAGEVQRRVRLRGVADRVDLFSDGTFRVLDYKSNRAPERSRSLQLPLYARCLEQQLEPHEGRRWRVGEAAFVAFGDPRFYVPLGGGSLDARLDAGESRAVTVLQDIERGDYPVRPVELYRCSFCAYPTVCRKDYVGDE